MTEQPGKSASQQDKTTRGSDQGVRDDKQSGMPGSRQEAGFPNRLIRLFGALDFVFAWIYLLIFIYVVPPFDPMIKWLAYLVSIAVMAGAVVMWKGGRIGMWTGLGVAVFLLVVCFTLVGLLVASAAYLYGLYGAFGKGATYVTLFAISLVVTYVGLLPSFQLSYLLRARPKREPVS